MKRILFFIFPLILSSCLQESVDKETLIQLKKAIIRSREVSSINQNIDSGNSASITFNTDFENQLVELNLVVKPMRTTEITILNENGNFHNLKNVLSGNSFYGNIDILLNDQSIKSCLVLQCKSTKCSNLELHDLVGDFETDKVYLNLSSLVNSSCSPIIEGVNNLKLVHIRDNEGPEFQGQNVRVQIIKYNLTYTPKGMRNAVNN